MKFIFSAKIHNFYVKSYYYWWVVGEPVYQGALGST